VRFRFRSSFCASATCYGPSEDISILPVIVAELKIPRRTAGTREQVSAKSAELGIFVRKYNTNRALKAAPEFAERVERSGHLLSYKLTARGQRLLDLLNLIDEPATPDTGAGLATERNNKLG
jgi:hypothetical protein